VSSPAIPTPPRRCIACPWPPGTDGHVGWLIADITRERVHQENIFQELQNAIDYLDHAPAGFFSLEPDGRIRYLNATLAEWIGVDLAEFEPGATHLRDIVTVDGLSLIQAANPRRSEAETLDVDLVRRASSTTRRSPSPRSIARARSPSPTPAS
jgi:two-component system cell cycle sensor histidine kinase/response regulator CckA